MPSKIAQLRTCAQASNWHGALRIAARFPRLGEHKEPITRAWSALQHPDFHRQIGQDPDALVTEGIEALKTRYCL